VTVAAPAHAARGDRRVTRDGERRGRNVRGADLEAAASRGDVGSRVAARAVTVGGAEPDVIGRDREDREYGIGGNAECPGDGGAVAALAAGHTLVGAGRGVLSVVAGRGVALDARRARRNVIARLARRHVHGEGGRRGVTVAAVAGARVPRVERRVGSRISRGGVAAGHHP